MNARLRILALALLALSLGACAPDGATPVTATLAAPAADEGTPDGGDGTEGGTDSGADRTKNTIGNIR